MPAKEQLENKLVSKNSKNMTAEVDIKQKEMEDSVLEGLTSSERRKKTQRKILVEGLQLEKDFKVAVDDKDKKREQEIKSKNLKTDQKDYSKEIAFYNPLYNQLYLDLKFDILHVRYYPFLELAVQTVCVLVIAAIDTSPIA